MCYIPNVRARTCRFGPSIFNKKVEQRCAFCKRTRNMIFPYWMHSQRGHPQIHQPTRFSNPCPALRTPGYVLVEPDMEVKHSWEIIPGVIVETGANGMVVGVQILDTPQPAVTTKSDPHHDRTMNPAGQ